MARGAKSNASNGARVSGPQSLNAAVWSICDVLRRSNCAGALQYVPELTRILFLRVLDSMEAREEDEATAVGDTFIPSLSAPYRWRDWAAPDGAKRKQLEAGKLGDFFGFVNNDLIPHLKALARDPNSTARQKVIGEALSGLERTRVDTERNFLDVLDRVHKIDPAGTDEQHMFILSQVLRGLAAAHG
jgi:type I restriction enzyme M protein